MKGYLFIVLSLVASAKIFSQKQFSVMDWKTDVTLNTYLVQQMHKQYDERRKNFDKALISKQSVTGYIESIKKKFLQILGDLPEQSSLNAKTTGTIRQDGYKIEKIVYESFPHHHVTSNLYIPAGKGPFPAALLFCGHEDLSKATESYQQTALLFVKNGFVVFVIDPVSQSERYQLTDEKGKPLTRGGTTEHTLLNEASNLFGNSAPAYELWDNVRGLDYLVTRKEVDTSKIGCLGNSGGGMQTIYFAAWDQRVKVIAPCSYLANRERTMEMTGPADGCAQIPGEGKMQLELSDYLIAAAPKPLLILAGRYDFIDYTGTVIAFDELKKVYSKLSQPEKLQLFTYDDGHGISQPKREAAVTWFRKWLYNDPVPVKEIELNTLTDKELFCTATGQINSEYPDEISLAKRNIELYNNYASRRNNFLKQNKETIQKKIKELLGINDISEKVNVQDAGTAEKDKLIYHKLIVRKTNEPPLPLLVVSPRSDIKKVAIWVSESGKNKMADSTILIQSYIEQGAAVILADIRGTGETEDGAEFNDPKYFNKEYRNAMTALHIARSLPGQRTEDIFSIMQFIAGIKNLSGKPVELNATGINTLPALYATLFSNGISQLNLYQSIKSYKEILERPVEKNWYSYVIPGVLKYYDIPDLVKMIGGAKVTYK